MIKLKKAVLLIHGFAGGTYDMESLAWKLGKNSSLDVFMFTLPGHGYKDRTLATGKEWIKASEEKVKTLISYGYSSIYVVGHSMGGIIAAYLATKFPEIKKVVLAAPAFKYIAERENFSFKKTNSIISNYGISEIASRFTKLPLSAFNEFIKFVKKYQNCPKEINVPILIVQGTKDDVVPSSSAEYVYDNVKTINRAIVYLVKSNHNIFNGCQKDIANEKIEKFLLGVKPRGEKEYI